ncbi:MAG TPA: hypothetical protein VGE06_03720, partial [Flavisolibacter sp.]
MAETTKGIRKNDCSSPTVCYSQGFPFCEWQDVVTFKYQISAMRPFHAATNFLLLALLCMAC